MNGRIVSAISASCQTRFSGTGLVICLTLAACLATVSCSGEKQVRRTSQEKDGYVLITQDGGPSIGYSSASGVKILTVDGYAFKDLDRDGTLDVYEDWRNTFEDRARDLASDLSIREIAGLMLYSGHQALPMPAWWGSYGGKWFDESDAEPWDLTDQQKKFLAEDNLRHVLITRFKDTEVAVRWNNNMQAYVEGLGHGIPCNNSSDPRHNGADADAEYNAGAGGDISLWPTSMGMAATFDPDLMLRFGQIAAKEYRALGIATALSPQVDLATEPRWNRFQATMGEDPVLAADMARAYCDGFQTSYGDDVLGTRKGRKRSGWGMGSVNAMVKHWPGGGPCEAGRDAHMGFGKFAVYPGGNFEMHKLPFTEGAFRLKDGTGKASAVMPYYTIPYNQTQENVANGYNKEIITDMLRGEAGYDGVVCTDWAITQKYEGPGIHGGKPWGVEDLAEAERHYKVIMAGCDQFGGNNEIQPVLDAYEIGVREHGEAWMRERMEQSARRLLLNIFRTGLFENPYLDLKSSEAVVGCPEYMAEGYEAQKRSVIMLKNRDGLLPLKDFSDLKVYVPELYRPEHVDFWGTQMEETRENPVEDALIDRYFGSRAASPQEADIAVVFIGSPDGGFGYSREAAEKGEYPYEPISLQYSDYTAAGARETSLAGGDPYEEFTDRSYNGRTVRTINVSDMETVQETRKAMGDRPVIVVATLVNPFVLSEIEPYADALFLTFYTQNQIIFEFMTGEGEPSGLLPFQMPADMLTVEEQCEDVPGDMRCYVDSEGHTYGFAFGMNWDGIINDWRTRKYGK